MKKIILIGGTKAGKTTLLEALKGKEYREIEKRTQSLEYENKAIDTPGEYIENRRFYTSLISAAQDAAVIGLVADATAEQYFLPPAFASAFARPVIGIVTKIDSDEADLEYARETLEMSGAEKIFFTSAVTRAGLNGLAQYIDEK